jgi:hypothetical protein
MWCNCYGDECKEVQTRVLNFDAVAFSHHHRQCRQSGLCTEQTREIVLRWPVKDNYLAQEKGDIIS